MATKVTFELAANIVADATEGILVGEFNNWDFTNGISLTKQKDGSLKTSLALEPGQTYQYRYFLNDGRWVNDDRADRYNFVHDYQVDNCVVTVPVVEEKVKKAAKPKAPKAEEAVEKKPKATTKAKAIAKVEEAAPAKKEATAKTKKAAKK